jgi:hypothetical protein
MLQFLKTFQKFILAKLYSIFKNVNPHLKQHLKYIGKYPPLRGKGKILANVSLGRKYETLQRKRGKCKRKRKKGERKGRKVKAKEKNRM